MAVSPKRDPLLLISALALMGAVEGGTPFFS